MNIKSTFATIGALAWIVSEILERTAAGLTSTSLILTLVAFVSLAIGVWGLTGKEPATRTWNVPVALTSLGFTLFAAVTAQMLATGLDAHPEGALLGAAILSFTLGALGLGIVALRSSRHPRAVSGTFLVAAILGVVGSAGEIAWLGSAANIVFSLTIIAMAVPTLGLRPAALPAVEA